MMLNRRRFVAMAAGALSIGAFGCQEDNDQAAKIVDTPPPPGAPPPPRTQEEYAKRNPQNKNMYGSNYPKSGGR